jgi:predicted esterase
VRFRVLPHLITLLAASVIASGAPAADRNPPTGWLKSITFSERSPHSTIEAWLLRVKKGWTGRNDQFFPELTWNEVIALEYDTALETFDVKVPPSYRTGDAHGLFIWNGVTAPNQDWYDIIARHKLIFVTANCSGRAGQIRTGLDLDAIHNLSKHYTIDPARIYIAGFSAGAHHSARMIHEYPDVIRGALLLSGGIFYESEKGEPSVLGFAWHGPWSLEQIKRETKIVSITGAGDTVVQPEYARADRKALTLDGFERINYIELPNSGHNHPNSTTFEKGIELLDAPPNKPPTTEPTKDPNPSAAQLAQAERLLRTATRMAEHGIGTSPQFRRLDQQNDLNFARECAQKVIDDYPSTSFAVPAKTIISRIDEKLKSEADERAAATTRRAPPSAVTQSVVEMDPPASSGVATTQNAARTRVTFTQRSPLSGPESVFLRLDREPPQRTPQMAEWTKSVEKWVYQLPREPFEVVVPAGYKKLSPHGLVVWLGSGQVPDAWLAALAQQKLILIGPANRFDERVTIVRVGLALDAVYNAKKKYAIDDKRIYLAGYSGGALLGSWMIRAYPDVFDGALLMMGGWFYHVNRMPSDFSPNRVDEDAWYPSRWTLGPRWKLPLEQIKRDTKIVLMRGERDDAFGYSIEQERAQYEGLRLDGFLHARYLEIPGASHNLPSAAWFAKGLKAFDSSPAPPPTTQPTQDAQPSADAIAQADRILAVAKRSDWNDMDALAQRIIDDYPHTPAADEARAFLEKGGGKRFWKRPN